MRLEFCHWCEEHPHDPEWRQAHGGPAVSYRYVETNGIQPARMARIIHLTQQTLPVTVIEGVPA